MSQEVLEMEDGENTEGGDLVNVARRAWLSPAAPDAAKRTRRRADL
jgi:hypothetical protein